MVTTIDLSEKAKDTKQYRVVFENTFDSNDDPLSQIIVFDPRKDVILQIKSGGNAWSLETTSTAGFGNTDIEDASVPWILLKSAITDDFHTGEGLVNRGILAVKITVTTIGADFKVYAAQQTLEERGKS